MTKTSAKRETITLYRLVEGFRSNGLPKKARIKRMPALVTPKRYWPDDDALGFSGIDRDNLPIGIGTDPLEMLEAAVEDSEREVRDAEKALQEARDRQRKRLELWAELREK